LSLDQVFRDNSADRPSGARNYSFDQFYSDGSAEPAPANPEEASTEAPAETGDDIAQFNAWLNDLKKT
jgi:hypothetical protein